MMQAKYLALHTQKTEEQIIRDFQRPRYFNPYEAVSYGLIDMVSCPDFREMSSNGEEAWRIVVCIHPAQGQVPTEYFYVVCA